MRTGHEHEQEKALNTKLSKISQILIGAIDKTTNKRICESLEFSSGTTGVVSVSAKIYFQCKLEKTTYTKSLHIQ